jgi:ATP-dependent DNA helicase RecG
MKEDVSVPRNPVLAKLFRIAKLCESAGYGFDKMLLWKKETNQEVLFESTIDKTKVTFMLKEGKLDLSDNQENNKKTTRKQQENNVDSDKKSNKKTDKKTTRKQVDVKNQILRMLKLNPDISTREMAQKMDISYGSLRHHLEKMRKEDIIKREGADKGGKWVIIK